MLKVKRLLTDKELEEIIKLEDPKKIKKYLEKIKDQLFYDGSK
jgi:hypothetical protein